MMKGVIFDMDGLLFDTEPIYRESWEILAPQFGVVHNPDFLNYIAGTSGKTLEDTVHRFYPTVDANAYHTACFKRVDEITSQQVRKMSGVDEILSFLKKNGLAIALASSSSLKKIHTCLKLGQIEEYFDSITCGAEIENGKPEPDIFLLAASRLGLAPEECYVFEDSVNGALAGIKSGCRTIMIPDIFKPTKEIEENAWGIYPSLLDAMKYLEF